MRYTPEESNISFGLFQDYHSHVQNNDRCFTTALKLVYDIVGPIELMDIVNGNKNETTKLAREIYEDIKTDRRLIDRYNGPANTFVSAIEHCINVVSKIPIIENSEDGVAIIITDLDFNKLELESVKKIKTKLLNSIPWFEVFNTNNNGHPISQIIHDVIEYLDYEGDGVLDDITEAVSVILDYIKDYIHRNHNPNEILIDINIEKGILILVVETDPTNDYV